jgi:hypothetical protein
MRPSYAWQAQSRAPRRDQHYCFTLSRDAGDAIARRRSSTVASVVAGPVEATSSPEIQEVSAEPTGRATTNLGHPNLAGVDCSG